MRRNDDDVPARIAGLKPAEGETDRGVSGEDWIQNGTWDMHKMKGINIARIASAGSCVGCGREVTVRAGGHRRVGKPSDDYC